MFLFVRVPSENSLKNQSNGCGVLSFSTLCNYSWADTCKCDQKVIITHGCDCHDNSENQNQNQTLLITEALVFFQCVKMVQHTSLMTSTNLNLFSTFLNPHRVKIIHTYSQLNLLISDVVMSEVPTLFFNFTKPRPIKYFSLMQQLVVSLWQQKKCLFNRTHWIE